MDKKENKKNDSGSKKSMNRRDFIRLGFQAAAFVSIASVSGYLVKKSMDEDLVWQIDPYKCTQCGRCATSCVLNPSAVKCVHIYIMCGYCNLCSGYFVPNVKELNTGAENLLCPTKALKRSYIEKHYYKYDIDRELCIGCAKCVKGCSSFGNGSLHLQIIRDLCKKCNQCSIAKVCPSGAFKQISASKAYLLKSGWKG
ncbi:MAG: ferredoxin [Bacteroidia bacterium]|nr:ferredoxin [Bacteroidia bacterium]